MTEVSPSGGNRLTAQRVVDDFASGAGEHVDWIGPRFAFDNNAQHKFAVEHLPANPIGLDRRGIFDGPLDRKQAYWSKLPFRNNPRKKSSPK